MMPIARRVEQNRRRREENQRSISTRRLIRQEHDPFDLPDLRFVEIYRLDKEMVRNLFRILIPHLNQPVTRRAIGNEKKILATLRFYATGSYQRCVGEEYNCGLSQSAVHFCVHDVTRVIVENLVPQLISLPSTVEERNIVKSQFMGKFGFPGSIGAIDGTHIAILKPSEDEHNFINRKGYHSINCQIICDANLRIINLLANYGGSTHDSFIWNNSQIKVYIERNHAQGEAGWLIGDTGYPQTSVLMTPFLDPQEGTANARYNNAHMRARNTVERCIGVLKGRFRCLLEERSSRYQPPFMCKVIKACAALHNMCIARNILVDVEDVADHEINDVPVAHHPGAQHSAGLRTRQRIVERYFQQ